MDRVRYVLKQGRRRRPLQLVHSVKVLDSSFVFSYFPVVRYITGNSKPNHGLTAYELVYVTTLFAKQIIYAYYWIDYPFKGPTIGDA